jgi:hypothetical protein
MKKALVLALVAITGTAKLVGAGQQSAAHSNISQADFTIMLSSPQVVVKPGTEIRIEYTIRNISAKTLIFNGFGARDYSFSVRVRDSQDREPSLQKDSTERAFKEGVDLPVGGARRYYVEPGGSLKTEIILTDVYDLSAPGKYTIQILRPDETTKTLIKSNTIALTVAP